MCCREEAPSCAFKLSNGGNVVFFSPDGIQSEYDKITCKRRLGLFLESFFEYWLAKDGLNSQGCRADLESIMIL